MRLHDDTVAIPSQYVRAPVDTCRILNGGLEPPADVHRVCFWAGGSRLEAPAGTTVITGHVNWSGQGTGALGNIGRLRPGDTVLTAGRSLSGRLVTSSWRVAAVWHRPKTKGIDPTAFVGRDGPRTLYLVTCGGAYDSSERSYVDNIYVRAVPVSSPSVTAPTSVHAG